MAAASPHLQVVRPRFAAGAPSGPAASPAVMGQRSRNARSHWPPASLSVMAPLDVASASHRPGCHDERCARRCAGERCGQDAEISPASGQSCSRTSGSDRSARSAASRARTCQCRRTSRRHWPHEPHRALSPCHSRTG